MYARERGARLLFPSFSFPKLSLLTFFEFATAPPSQPLSNDDDDAIEEEQGDIAIVVAEEEHAFSLDAVSKPHADASFVRLEEKEGSTIRQESQCLCQERNSTSEAQREVTG